MYICPICGWDEMNLSPDDFNICDCCGTEFGFDDFEREDKDLTNIWIKSGMKWWNDAVLPPKNWKPKEQLKNIKRKTYEKSTK